jgi:4-hydroxy-tetrahydrodipicolinate reductase
MAKVIITGAKGRMGQALIACAKNFSSLELVAALGRNDPLDAVIDRADVVIDFSLPHATSGFLALCQKHRKAIVIGTTGHTPAEKASIVQAAAAIPVVLASNYSTGVNALFWLTRKAAEILGTDFDLEVVEMHHRLKKDAPSGTAKSLAEILAEVRHQQLDQVARHGRVGLVGARQPSEIGIHSLRGGDVVGDHTVVFANTGERLELTHKASSRETFANGALRAAQWLANQKPGLYDMQDVLGLK